MRRVKLSFEEDGDFFELEEDLCSCEPSPLPTIDFIFVQIESGPKHSSDFSVPACKTCHKLMVSQERLEICRNEDPADWIFSNPPGFPLIHPADAEEVPRGA